MRRFKQVDVFTSRPFFGNPVAVVIDAEGLDTAAMQRIAGWTNLSETTFLQKSDKADYRVRIFTPRQELPFAGHPTIGSAHAAIESGFATPKDGRLRQECGAGVLELAAEGSALFVKAPQPRMRALERAEHGALAHALGVGIDKALRVDVGAVWLVAEVPEVARLTPDMVHLAALSDELGAAGATLFSPSSDGQSALHVRSFAPAHGIAEDPVCGSGNIGVAAFLRSFGRAAERYTARQGLQVGRDGRVQMRVGAAEIWLGGEAVTCIEGRLNA
jgi:PhzF family phenazine biosynthesis protein